jgi:hypothetical protein
LPLPQDGAWSDGDPALGHHGDEVTVRKFVLEVPADAVDDDLALKLASPEEIVEARTLLVQTLRTVGD